MVIYNEAAVHDMGAVDLSGFDSEDSGDGEGAGL